MCKVMGRERIAMFVLMVVPLCGWFGGVACGLVRYCVIRQQHLAQ